MSFRFSESPEASLLNRLVFIRILTLASAFIIYLVGSELLQLELPIELILATAAYGIFSIFLIWIRPKLTLRISELELSAYIAIDVLLLTLFLFFSGGAANPFVSYYVVLIAMSTAFLSQKIAWLTVLLSIAGYSFLMWIQPLGSHHEQEFNWHLWGMWANFLVVALILGAVVARMSHNLRQQQRLLNEERESAVRDEQILATGILAASTAHELGTPLASLSILIEQLENSIELTNEAETLRLMESQIDVCRSKLKSLSILGSVAQTEAQVPIDAFMKTVLEQWVLIRPNARWHIHYEGCEAVPMVKHPIALQQAILNILNNAADASENPVEVNVTWSESVSKIMIKDDGPGFSQEKIEELGKPFISTKPSGIGIGLFLAYAAIERVGGNLDVANLPHRGTAVTLTLHNKEG